MRGMLLLILIVILVTTWQEVSGEGPAQKDEYPDGFWFGRQDLICVRRTDIAAFRKKVKRSTSRVFVHDISHTVLYFRGRYYEWGTNPRGYRAEETPKATSCPITWRQRPAGTSRCSTDHAVRFARQYAVTYGDYNLIFNNCHHFVNRLAAILETSECSTQGRGDDAVTGMLSGLIDTVGSWWTGLTGSRAQEEQPEDDPLSTDHTVRFARQYAFTYLGYDVIFNNCNHFVNRLAAMLETSECSIECQLGVRLDGRLLYGMPFCLTGMLFVGTLDLPARPVRVRVKNSHRTTSE
ncbi:hypothetical protein NP493_138g00015 [Ridgeia piscesae]|uniref:Lecithin retinol acyltransferase n=1 Tax=Ridgeia piscesae TaxID=27915 RepID=A0AAD9P551_RIDPI|nr:hypothetical protein NP493_138g00015 [Ridgeia piscesae]